MNLRETKEIHIIGAGLSGLLLAILFRKRGYEIHLYEKKPDPRVKVVDHEHLISFTLSQRGIHAFRKVGLDQAVFNQAIPMYGYYLHAEDGSITILPYSSLKEEHLYSISRLGVNQVLLQEAEKQGVHLYFEYTCEEIDLAQKRIFFQTPDGRREVPFSVLFGADGAGAPIRQSFKKHILHFKESINLLDYGYKELTIPPSEEGSFRFLETYLHIWPRRSFMMLALPNVDKTFSCTLFLPLQNEKASFAQLKAPDNILSFFQRAFPDAFPHLLNLLKEFSENPIRQLETLCCDPWYYQGDVLLLSDAAHMSIPFFGQEMNVALEDSIILDQLLDSCQTWEELFSSFFQQRRKDVVAIVEFALENFIEMRKQILDSLHQQRKQIELALEKYYPDQFYSKYRLVTFTSIPIHKAIEQGELQEKFLENWILLHGYPTTEKLSYLFRELKKHLKEKGYEIGSLTTF